MDSVKTIFTKMLVENKYPPNNILFTHFSVSEQLKVSISSTLTESLDSVRDMISRLSMAENRMLHNVSFVYSSIKSKLTTPNIIQARLSPHIDAPSATAILLKLSVVRNNHPDIALLTHPRIKEVAVVAGSLPVAEKLHVPVTLAGRKSFPSATAMLLKLSVVKNNRIVVVLAPHRPKVVG